MQRTRLRFRRTSAADDGFTLIELTITVALLVLVLLMFFEALGSAQRSQSFAQDRSETLDALQLTMARVTKDARQATSLDPSSSDSVLHVQTYVDGVLATVVYQISGTTLTRSVNGGAGIVLVTNLASPSLFTYEPSASNAQVVTILLQATPKNSPHTTVHLTSEVRLRNLSTS
jgi:prepilin-type N-terminal cleavage/methylation domain-containing protein